MGRDVPASLRRRVAQRAQFVCEYCQVPEIELDHQIDHIVAIKHNGSSDFDNLAYACLSCNLHKGSDVFAVGGSGESVRLFNPRQQAWDEHFALRGAFIEPLTIQAEATVLLLRMNEAKQVVKREGLRTLGLYPSGSRSQA